jgi:Kelch motif
MNRIAACLAFSIAASSLVGQATWSVLYPTMSPPARGDAVMACHEATGDLILLGGSGTTGTLADGWRLQGNSWAQLPGPLPPSRTHASMVYDSARQRLVMFGGNSSGGPLQDTWEWNGQTWTSPLLLVKPPARWGHAMAFDRERGVTVLYGGYLSTSAFFGDLWEWDGTAWQQIATTNAPGPRFDPTMAFDPINENVLLFGGSVPVAPNSSTAANDTWSWDGSSWQQHQPATPPFLRFGARIVCDSARRRVVLFGGSLGGPFAWQWDGQQWQLMLQASPAERGAHMMAYDAANRRVVMFGGVWNSGMLADTWQFKTNLPAVVAPYGAGCAGTAGIPELRNATNSLPWLGDTVHHFVTNIAPGGPGALFVSSSRRVHP